MKVSVFLGPSLPLEHARRLLDAEYLPPVRRGDIERLLTARPDIIGIVDGEFFQSLSVSPKEILLALRAGVTVLGAASIGALRAVELAPFGMVGIGIVYRLFQTGRVDADDEVALMYDAADYRPLSTPLVNFRVALEEAVRCGVMRRTVKRTLLRRLKALYFPERSIESVLALAKDLATETELLRLEVYLREEAPDAKRADAVALLSDIRRRVQKGRVA